MPGGMQFGGFSQESLRQILGLPWSRLRASHFDTVPPNGWLVNQDLQQVMSQGVEDAGVLGALSQQSGPPCRASSGGCWAVAVPYL